MSSRPTPPLPGVAAFDFDGTLVAGDSLPRFLARLLGPAGFAATLTWSAPAMGWRYLGSGRDGAKAALLARSVAGLDAEEVAAEGKVFARRLAARVRPDMRETMAWHDARGHRRILVSASLAAYLEPFGTLQGFAEVIATRLEVGSDGRLTGRMDGANVRAEQKALRLSESLGPSPVELWAYGDSAGDAQMLAMAEHPTLVGRRRAWAGGAA
ncbi:MAG: HAD-IB family hydrolase [Acidimicrobiales bacterium]